MDITSSSSLQTNLAERYHAPVTAVAETDEQLLAQVQQKSRAALEVLYDRHCAKAMGIALQTLNDSGRAEYVVREAYWCVWKYAYLIPDGKDVFTDWFFAGVQHLAMTELSSKAPEPRVDSAEEFWSFLKKRSDPGKNETRVVLSNLNPAQVKAALDALPKEQRQVIEFAYFRGMTRYEIAQRLGVSTETVASWARLGLAQLDNLMRVPG